MAKTPKTTPEKPPTPSEAAIFSKALRGAPLTKTQEQTLGGRGLSELAAVARQHAAAVAQAEAAKKAAAAAKAAVAKAVKAAAKPKEK